MAGQAAQIKPERNKWRMKIQKEKRLVPYHVSVCGAIPDMQSGGGCVLAIRSC